MAQLSSYTFSVLIFPSGACLRLRLRLRTGPVF